MSAFVISDETMTRAVKAILGVESNYQVIRTFAGIDTAADNAGTEIGRRLFTLNIEAVTQRYPDCIDEPANMPGTDGCATLSANYVFPDVPSRLSKAEWIDCYKALQCLEYQCAEGDVPKTPLFAELRSAIATAAHMVISKMPEYDAARWG